MTERDRAFWNEMTNLAGTNRIVVDRKKETSHPRYPGLIYPLDYGYLGGTTAGDGDGIDLCSVHTSQKC